MQRFIYLFTLYFKIKKLKAVKIMIKKYPAVSFSVNSYLVPSETEKFAGQIHIKPGYTPFTRKFVPSIRNITADKSNGLVQFTDPQEPMLQAVVSHIYTKDYRPCVGPNILLPTGNSHKFGDKPIPWDPELISKMKQPGFEYLLLTTSFSVNPTEWGVLPLQAEPYDDITARLIGGKNRTGHRLPPG